MNIGKDEIEAYQTKRLETKAKPKPATINRETTYLKLGIKLLGLPVLVIEKLAEDNVRTGFILVPEFDALLQKLKNPNVRDLVEFLYNCAWRSSEPSSLDHAKN